VQQQKKIKDLVLLLF